MSDDVNEYPLPIALLPASAVINTKRALLEISPQKEIFKYLIRNVKFDDPDYFESHDWLMSIHRFFDSRCNVVDWVKKHIFDERTRVYNHYRDSVIRTDCWRNIYDGSIPKGYGETYMFFMQIFSVLMVDVVKGYAPIYKSTNGIVLKAIKEFLIKQSWIDPDDTESMRALCKAFEENKTEYDYRAKFNRIMNFEGQYSHTTFSGLQVTVVAARCIIPSRFNVGFRSTDEENWLAELAIKALYSIKEDYRASVTEHILAFKFGQKSRDYKHLSELYSKLAVRQDNRLAPINRRAESYQNHLESKKMFSFSQKIMKGKWDKGSVYDVVKRRLKNSSHSWHTFNNDAIKTLIRDVLRGRVHLQDSTKRYSPSLTRQRAYFASKADNLRGMFYNFHRDNDNDNVYVQDFDDYRYYDLDLDSDEVTDWEDIYIGYRKYVAHRSLRLRMARYVVEGRSDAHVEQQRKLWESRRKFEELTRKLCNLVPTSTLTISPKGKRLYEVA